MCFQHGRTLGGGKVVNAPLNMFLYKNNFWLLSWKGEIKNWVGSGGKGCLYIKDRLETIFLRILTRLFRKLKFLLPMIEFVPPVLLAK